jgi:limonene-1,2-epoxide hydrolase
MAVDRASIRDRLAHAPDRAEEIASRASAPSPGEWSAREVLLHLAAVDQEVWQPRLDSLARADGPVWSWVEPGLWSGPGDEIVEGALAAFRYERGATIARIDALDDEGWARHGVHATYGRLDIAGLLRVLADHDEEHLSQIAALES